jgi:hypothetical protein
LKFSSDPGPINVSNEKITAKTKKRSFNSDIQKNLDTIPTESVA